MSRVPPHSGKEMVAAFELEGWAVVRTRGSHVVMAKEGRARPVVVPLHDEVSQGVIHSNLKTAGISKKEYMSLLRGCRHEDTRSHTTVRPRGPTVIKKEPADETEHVGPPARGQKSKKKKRSKKRPRSRR
ncbi:MAG: type II toxin-antitoxin system HicA family toxin [Deltaproteobacteria bacterium]|nr:type II toxin-antitoxin system HicA family toxin [Deltaproteobacteria bacterium]